MRSHTLLSRGGFEDPFLQAIIIHALGNTQSRLLTHRGATLFPGWDRFLLLSHLGSGGTGVVYEAHDATRGHPVALKMLSCTDPEGLARLKQEFRALVELEHPNLIDLYELHEHKGQWFYTMELLDGTGFRSYVRFGPPIVSLPNEGETLTQSPPRLAPIRSGSADELTPEAIGRLRDGLSQIVEGLAVVHEAGQLHRDIKPSNVLVTREGRVVILDFGLVTEHGLVEDGRTFTMVGTPAYMPPSCSMESRLRPATGSASG